MTTCPNDGKEFEQTRAWQRFCSSTCRYQFRWRNFRVVPVDELRRLVEITQRLAASEDTNKGATI